MTFLDRLRAAWRETFSLATLALIFKPLRVLT
jgi:hypothetical protein